MFGVQVALEEDEVGALAGTEAAALVLLAASDGGANGGARSQVS